MINGSPPKWANRFLEWYCNPDILEDIQGDAHELYQRTLKKTKNKKLASLNFTWNVIRFFRWKNIRRFKINSYSTNHFTMILHYLQTGLRSLLKSKGHAFINLTGLSIGLAGFILIALFIQHEFSFDQYHEKKDQIFRLVFTNTNPANPTLAKVQGPTGPALQSEIPEIKNVVRFSPSSDRLLEVNEKQNYEPGGFYVDPSIFDVFNFPVLSGNAATALSKPNSIVLTKSLATVYFGTENPIGKIVTLDNQFPMEVTALIEDVPQNSHFTFSYLLPIEFDTRGWKENWNAPWQYYTYFLLDPEANQEAIKTKTMGIISKHIPENQDQPADAVFQPLTSIHLHSNLFRELVANGNMQTIYIYFSIGIFLLLIACINFMNMMTAKATERLKEVGVRKTMGAVRTQLIGQFLSESVLLTLCSAILAVGIAFLVLPSFNNLVGVTLSLSLLSNSIYLTGFIILILGVALFAGTYPAFYLSSLTPMQLQKGITRSGKGTFRKALVVFQFCISAFLILALQIITQQLSYMQNKDLGFDKELIVNVPVRNPKTLQNGIALKSQLKSNDLITDVSFSANLLGGSDYGIPTKPEGFTDNVPEIRMLIVDADFIKTHGMNIIEGRNFSDEIQTDITESYLINEAGAKALGWVDPIGKKISIPVIGRGEGKVIGVLQDFNFRSLRESVQPMIFFMKPEWFGTASIKIKGSNIQEAIRFLENQWKTLEPDYPFTYSFLDESIAGLYESEQRTQNIVQYASVIAIVIACVGLFSLASFNVEKHKKEFGIRKVLGASVMQITAMQLKQYTLLAICGSAIAILATVLLMGKWFNNFAYKVSIGPWVFILGLTVVLVISWVTVGFQCIKAGMTNPVNTLKQE